MMMMMNDGPNKGEQCSASTAQHTETRSSLTEIIFFYTTLGRKKVELLVYRLEVVIVVTNNN